MEDEGIEEKEEKRPLKLNEPFFSSSCYFKAFLGINSSLFCKAEVV